MGKTTDNQAATARVANATYRELISKDKEEKQSDQRESDIEISKNNLEMGILGVKAQAINAQKELKQSQSAVAAAEATLLASYAGVPLRVQSILDYRTRVLQAQENLAAKQEEYQSVIDAETFLNELKKTLFPEG